MTPRRTGPGPHLRGLALLLGVAAAGCQTEGDYFFLERNGAVMPIWVRGNQSSGVYVLALHGGPGSSAQWFIDTPAFQALERRYAVAYWDQRGSGTSQGTPPTWSYAVDELVADLDAVVAVLRARYPVQRFFVLSHSWGGFLATAWLTEPSHQALVSGSVMVDGAYDLADLFEAERQFVAAYAQQQVDAGVDVAGWEDALAWAAPRQGLSSDQWPLADVGTLSAYVQAARGDVYQGPARRPSFSRVFLSPLDYFATQDNLGRALTPAAYDFFGPRLLGTDLTPGLAALGRPTLLTWGRHDGTVPAALGQRAYDALGTEPADKALVFFEASAHSPFAEEPGPWSAAVTGFIDAH
jgi:proline iminopeptidase